MERRSVYTVNPTHGIGEDHEKAGFAGVLPVAIRDRWDLLQEPTIAHGRGFGAKTPNLHSGQESIPHLLLETG